MKEALSPILASTPEMRALQSFCDSVDARTGLWLRTNALELAYNAYDFTGADLGHDSIAFTLLTRWQTQWRAIASEKELRQR